MAGSEFEGAEASGTAIDFVVGAAAAGAAGSVVGAFSEEDIFWKVEEDGKVDGFNDDREKMFHVTDVNSSKLPLRQQSFSVHPATTTSYINRIPPPILSPFIHLFNTIMTSETPGALLAETLITDTHLNQNPSTQPQTAFDSYHPLHIPASHRHKYRDPDDSDFEESGTDDTASISSSILDRPSSAFGYRRQSLPPLPDLRFEQSYLASIAPANGVWWKIILITLRDQVVMALLQGMGFKLATLGWRKWNSGVRFVGNSAGGKKCPSLSSRRWF